MPVSTGEIFKGLLLTHSAASAFHEFSQQFPPKNRVRLGIDVLELHIVHSGGTLVLDPNGAVQACFTGELSIQDPIAPSFLSGKPGYLYRNFDGVELALTREELLRLIALNLQPAEFLKILGHFGEFYEIHDDFYDMETGESLQPRC